MSIAGGLSVCGERKKDIGGRIPLKRGKSDWELSPCVEAETLSAAADEFPVVRWTGHSPIEETKTQV